MKNFKHLALGLMVGALAIGFSSFTNARKLSAGDEYGNTGVGGNYDILTSAYNSASCTQMPNIQCAYEVTAAGASHITTSTLTSSQIATALLPANQWLVPVDNNKGVYSGF